LAAKNAKHWKKETPRVERVLSSRLFALQIVETSFSREDSTSLLATQEKLFNAQAQQNSKLGFPNFPSSATIRVARGGDGFQGDVSHNENGVLVGCVL